MNDKDIKAVLQRIRNNTRITKVVATRSFKSPNGDFFAGFSGAWNSVQDDVSGPGADMDLSVSDAEVMTSGLSLSEARVAHLMVAMEADNAAYTAAFANGAISKAKLDDARRSIKNNYGLLIREALSTSETTEEPAKV